MGCDEGVDLLPPLFLSKSSGKLVLKRAEFVTSCLKKKAKSYARSFRIPSGKGREILCLGNAKAFVSAASITGMPV
jgi:hypothetical protein